MTDIILTETKQEHFPYIVENFQGNCMYKKYNFDIAVQELYKLYNLSQISLIDKYIYSFLCQLTCRC